MYCYRLTPSAWMVLAIMLIVTVATTSAAGHGKNLRVVAADGSSVRGQNRGLQLFDDEEEETGEQYEENGREREEEYREPEREEEYRAPEREPDYQEPEPQYEEEEEEQPSY